MWQSWDRASDPPMHPSPKDQPPYEGLVKKIYISSKALEIQKESFGNLETRACFLAMGLFSSPVSKWATVGYITTLLAGFLFIIVTTQRSITFKWVLPLSLGLDHLCIKQGK